MFAYNTR